VRVTASRQFEEARIVQEIGRISAASEWRGQTSVEAQREAALRKLKELALEFEADAIVGLDFAVDAVNAGELAPVTLERVSATGVAVKLARG
jgi:uncharacterized protein YbjQ (UPF0145 family)